ncbi:MAG: protein jag [Patescibacteria group bacterium]|jgi:spoIIIJ-associated protein
MNKDQINQIKSEADKIIGELGVEAETGVSFDEETNVVSFQIDSPQAAMLIGFHGETLHCLQLILSFVAHKIYGQWVRVVVNVGDYRQKREEQLQKLALNLTMKAKFSGETQTIPNLSAVERRIVHLALADHPDVVSESEGEGRNRTLTIKPKTNL